MRQTVALVALIVFAASVGASVAQTPATSRAEAQPDAGDALVVQFAADATLAEVGEALADANATATDSTKLPGVALVAPAPGETAADAIAALEVSDAVVYAEPDYPVSATVNPNDQYVNNNCSVSGTTLAPCEWGPAYVNATGAWDTTTGSASVVVAVIDTGVQTTHPDLSGKLVPGYNTIAENTNVTDDNGHGTHVSGTIGAVTNNSAGVAGICWNCKIMPLKALDAAGGGSSTNIAEAINWAVTNGAEVINMSLGINVSGCPTSSPIQTAVNNAWANGVIVVAAAGNNADNADATDDCVFFPASHPNAVAVGAFASNGVRASFSNFGPELDVSAPGVYIMSTIMGSNYGLYSGTSMATPHVAGLVGLMISNGITDKNEIVSKLTSTATDAGTAGFDNYYGHGRINAQLAVQSSDEIPPVVNMTAPAAGATVSGNVSFTATASDAGGIQKVRFWAGSTYLGFDSTAPYSRTWNTGAGLNGKFTLKVEAIDLAGNSTVVTRPVTVINPDSTPPSVNVANPVESAVVSGALNVTANASDTQGLQKVQFWAGTTYLGYDSTAPYSIPWNTTAFPNGPRVVRARAVDWANNFTDATVTVTVANSDTTPPTAGITSPIDGATLSGTVSIAATASDNVGVQKVRFWVDGTYLGYDSTAAYTASWNTTGFSNGAHTVRVQSVDMANNISSDVIVTVTVSN